MLATDSHPFDSEGFIYEIKWDGIRCLAYIGLDDVRLRSRNNRDITGDYPGFAGMWRSVRENARPAILDGEIIVLKDGKPSFHEWQKRKNPKEGSLYNAVFVVFDVLYRNWVQVTSLELEKRKDMIQGMVVCDSPDIIISRIFTGKGTDIFKAVTDQGLEGIIAKRLGSIYFPGKRTGDWLKFKKFTESDFVVWGYVPGTAGDEDVGSLALGVYDGEGRLIYQGKVGSGLGMADKAYIKEYYKKYPMALDYGVHNGVHNIDGILSRKDLTRIKRVKPGLVCTVRYLEKSGGGLRHPSFMGFRFDKDPHECTLSEYAE